MIDQAARLRAMVSDGNIPLRKSSVELKTPRCSGHETRVIAVTSGKGGVGKTTIAVNLAVLLAESGAKVLIVDADLGLANVDVMLGLDSARHIGHLMMTDFTPDDIATVGPAGVRVISGGSGLRELAEASGPDRRALISRLKAYYGQFDYVFIDTSPGIRDEVVDFLMGADEVLLVTTPEPTSLRDTYAALKTLDRRIPDRALRIIVNASGSDVDARNAIEVLNSVTSKFLGRHYDRWHRIQSDELVGRSVHAHRAIVGLFPRSSASVCMQSLAHQLQLARHDCAVGALES